MSVITSYTISCDPRGTASCEEKVGPFPSLDEAVAAAEQAGWKLHGAYRHGSLLGDNCPAHIHIMDRIDWGSTA